MKLKLIPEIVPDEKVVNPPKNSPKKWWLIAVLILLSPWIISGIGLGVVVGGMYCSGKGIEKGNWWWARSCATTSAVVAQAISPLAPLAFGYPVNDLLAVARIWGSVVNEADQVINQLLPYLLVLVNPNAPTPTADVSSLTTAVSQLSETLAYLQSQLQPASQKWPQLASIATRIAASRTLVTKVGLVAGELPQLLSLTKPAQWLVLLQDDTELRPTGGFIDGIGLVTIENGHIKNNQWLATTAVDAQLKGQVAPPAELTKALGETNWYLRDSNWDPDFPVSASRSAWFVSRELGQTVDMVAAVNLSLLGEALKVVGPLDLPNFGGMTTADNWRDNYLRTVQIDSADRLAPVLAEKLWSRVGPLSSAQLRQLLQLVVAGLETDQLQLWPVYNSSALGMIGWDGRLQAPTCTSPFSCVTDFVYPIDTNIGINKVNAQVGRAVQIKATLDNHQVTTTYQLTWSNWAESSGWPLGEYRNYLRVYLPQSAEVKQVKWADRIISASEWEETYERGMLKLALSTSIPVGASRQLELTWSQAVPVASRWHYQLVLAHQSGVPAYPTQVTINYPSDWWSQAGPAPTVAQVGQIQYNFEVARTRSLNIDWVPSQ